MEASGIVSRCVLHLGQYMISFRIHTAAAIGGACHLFFILRAIDVRGNGVAETPNPTMA
jgi:hypothetical protein